MPTGCAEAWQRPHAISAGPGVTRLVLSPGVPVAPPRPTICALFWGEGVEVSSGDSVLWLGPQSIVEREIGVAVQGQRGGGRAGVLGESFHSQFPGRREHLLQAGPQDGILPRGKGTQQRASMTGDGGVEGREWTHGAVPCPGGSELPRPFPRVGRTPAPLPSIPVAKGHVQPRLAWLQTSATWLLGGGLGKGHSGRPRAAGREGRWGSVAAPGGGAVRSASAAGHSMAGLPQRWPPQPLHPRAFPRGVGG